MGKAVWREMRKARPDRDTHNVPLMVAILK
jgi:hypothetical protein